MEVEKVFFDFEPSYIISDDHANYDGCSLENTCYFQTSDHDPNNNIPTYSIQDFLPDDHVGPDLSFLNMENDLLEFDFTDKNSSLDGKFQPAASKGIDQQRIEYVAAAAADHDHEESRLREIQDELMEEGSCSLTDLLVTGAEAVEAGNVRFASVVAMRLNEILSGQENGDNPLDRLALYFTQGLLDRSLVGNDCPGGDPEKTAIPAFQMLQELSPYVKFAHFTANQAILEATEEGGDGGSHREEIHVIDFDILEGSQWPSLMVDLAARKDASLRITAVVGDRRSSTSTRKTGRRLQEFAGSINLSFSFDQVLITKAEDFEKIKTGRTLIANCMINQLHMPNRANSLVNTFFNGLKNLSPKIVVLVQDELFNFSKAPYMSFVEFFCEALDHYTAFSDSLRSGFCGGYKFASRVIEKEFLSMRILDCVKHFRCGMGDNNYGTCPSMSGFRRIPVSSCNVTQAKHLMSLFNGGYWVQNERCGLTLCWKSRPLTTASIWVPAAVLSRQNSIIAS